MLLFLTDLLGMQASTLTFARLSGTS